MEIKDWRDNPLFVGDTVLYRARKGYVEGIIHQFVVGSKYGINSDVRVKVRPKRRSDGQKVYARNGNRSVDLESVVKLV